MKIVISKYLLLLLALILISGCTWFTAREKVWTDLPDIDYVQPIYAAYLRDWKILLDPGHGGQSHLPGYKRGPTGVREAEVNLRVANYLKALLEEAGAEVYLTRYNDSFVSLEARAQMADSLKVDFMISLHHNASGNPSTNFVSVYYHKRPDLSPVSMDLARYVYQSLVDGLRLPQLSPLGLHSDQLIYPDGFGLLRRTNVPAILCESSFHSNPEEEQRLTDRDYNKREAYAIFRGVCHYALGGIPEVEIFSTDIIQRTKKPRLRVTVNDGVNDRIRRNRLDVFNDMIAVHIDGRKTPFVFDKHAGTISVSTDSILENGAHELDVSIVNLFKNSNWSPTQKFIVASPCREIRFEYPRDSILADQRAYLPVDIIFFDKDRMPVWDKSPVVIEASAGMLEQPDSHLTDGKMRVYLHHAGSTPSATLYARMDSVRDSLKIYFRESGLNLYQGEVRSAMTFEALNGAKLFLDDSLIAECDAYGSFFVDGLSPGRYKIKVEKRGYHPHSENIIIAENQTTVGNYYPGPIENGIFFNRTIIIDPQYGGAEKGDLLADTLSAANYNLALAQSLGKRLHEAGAEVRYIRDSDTLITVNDRIDSVNVLSGDWYLRLGSTKITDDTASAVCTVYPGSVKGERIAEHLLEYLSRFNFKTGLERGLSVPEVRNTNKTALALEIRIKEPRPPEQIAALLYKALIDYYTDNSNQKQ